MFIYIFVLKNFFLNFIFFRSCQSGFYFDFIYKKITDVFIRNVFIFGFQFFGEKYLIEYFSKNLINLIFFNFNKYFSNTLLNFMSIFFSITIFFFILF